MGAESVIVLPELANRIDMAKFKDKARQFLGEYESHVSLPRPRCDQPLTALNLAELERMLREAGGTQQSSSKPPSTAVS